MVMNNIEIKDANQSAFLMRVTTEYAQAVPGLNPEGGWYR